MAWKVLSVLPSLAGVPDGISAALLCLSVLCSVKGTALPLAVAQK